jgi:uncharacterized membrane protein YfcA
VLVFAAIGLAGGLLGGLLGVGGGFIMVPLQALWARTSMRNATATSLAAVLPIAIAATLIYYFGKGGHQVDLQLALLIVAGSTAGAYLGARFASRIPERQFKIAVALMLLVVGVKEVVLP